MHSVWVALTVCPAAANYGDPIGHLTRLYTGTLDCGAQTPRQHPPVMFSSILHAHRLAASSSTRVKPRPPTATMAAGECPAHVHTAPLDISPHPNLPRNHQSAMGCCDYARFRVRARLQHLPAHHHPPLCNVSPRNLTPTPPIPPQRPHTMRVRS